MIPQEKAKELIKDLEDRCEKLIKMSENELSSKAPYQISLIVFGKEYDAYKYCLDKLKEINL
jgi:hypothetical protein